MALDTSIYGNMLRTPKSAFEYADEFAQRDYRDEMQAMQRQQNALALGNAQAQARGAEESRTRQNALLADLRNLGEGATDDSRIGVYERHGHFDAADKIRTSVGTRAKTTADVKKTQAETEKIAFETQQARRMKHLQELVGVNDVPSAMQWLDDAAASGELPQDRIMVVKQQLAANPAYLQEWKPKAIAGGFTLQQQAEQQWRQREFALSQDKFGEEKRRNRATEGLTARGQNMTDARGRDANTLKAAEIASGGKPPPGYRWKGDGTLEAIPGGPGDKLPEAQQKQVVGTQNLSNAITEYRKSLAGFGKLDALSPNARAEMGTKYNNMLLQAKEAYNLGVLNGPDYAILQSVVTDPRSLTGAITSKSALDKQAEELDRIMGGIGAVSGNMRPQDGAPKSAQPTGPSQRNIQSGTDLGGGFRVK